MKKVFILLLLMPYLGIAISLNNATLNNFNLSQFQKCQRIIKQCSMTGPFHDNTCIKQKLVGNTTCASLLQLSQITNVQADLINVKQFNNLFLITLHYPADGKNAYGFLSSSGDFITTDIDLKKMDKNLALRFQSSALMLTPIKEPMYQKNLLSGTQQFILTVKVSENCLACQTVGVVNIVFSFNIKGKFTGAKLIRFSNKTY